ncbi:hypothetical protein DPMN_124003 [Dreissena polymorpha]|uniref:Uncharacterized protein n=1 Tax=Dreissena polymorpha TaxID=45954 RepID=A0A9D4JTG0_DREPO|nr:hypothetical protein DPMN_124003 [Dreissena polymorpha]
MSGRGRGVQRRALRAVVERVQREGGGCRRRSIRHRRMNQGPDGVEGLRREWRRYQMRHQPLFLFQNQRRHPQQNHLQSVDAQTIAPKMVRLLHSVILSTHPIGYHVVAT